MLLLILLTVVVMYNFINELFLLLFIKMRLVCLHKGFDYALNLCVLLFFAIWSQQQMLVWYVHPIYCTLPAIIVQRGIPSGVPSLPCWIMLLEAGTDGSIRQHNLFILPALMRFYGLRHHCLRCSLPEKIIFSLLRIARRLQTLIPINFGILICHHPTLLINLTSCSRYILALILGYIRQLSSTRSPIR